MCFFFFSFAILSNRCYVAIWAASLIGIFRFSGSLPLCLCLNSSYGGHKTQLYESDTDNLAKSTASTKINKNLNHA